MSIIDKKRKLFDVFFLIIVGFIFISLYSRSSPLYPMNNWEDTNCYFTVGKMMANGKILYRDIYEQKGPILYFIYWLLYTIFGNTWNGVFLLEIVCFIVFLYYNYRILSLYIENHIYKLISLVIIANAVLVSQSFVHGGSVEELNLCFLSLSMYKVLCVIKTNGNFNNSDALIVGITSAFAFWTKYTICGFYLGIVLFVCIYSIKNKCNLGKLVFNYILGFLSITLIVFIYFIINNALYDLFYVYFYSNIFMYETSIDKLFFAESLIRNIYATLFEKGLLNFVTIFILRILDTFIVNYLYTFFITIGFIYILIKAKKHKMEALFVFISFFCLTIFCLLGQQVYIYYCYPICIYTLFGFIAIYNMFNNYNLLKIISVCFGIFCIVFGYKRNINTIYMKYDRKQIPQYIFADIIDDYKQDATLLNYGFLDGGFYYASNITPSWKYFFLANSNVPEMREYLDNIVEMAKADFVVTKNCKLSEYAINSENYSNIKEAFIITNNGTETYYLYINNVLKEG